MRFRFHDRNTSEDSFVTEETPNLQAIADELAKKHGLCSCNDIDKIDLALVALERLLQDKK